MSVMLAAKPRPVQLAEAFTFRPHTDSERRFCGQAGKTAKIDALRKLKRQTLQVLCSFALRQRATSVMLAALSALPKYLFLRADERACAAAATFCLLH